MARSHLSPLFPTGRLIHILSFLLLLSVAATAQQSSLGPAPIAGTNVNMVSGTALPAGDPYLRQQNGPTIAVSTRNPQHILAGANDYRTIDYPGGDIGVDAWMGVFKSYDGGKSWQSALLPGFPQDTSAQGLASPLHGWQAGSDVIARAGTNGLMYYAGMVLNRDKPSSMIFLSRFIDNNNKENGDSIQYINTTQIQKGQTNNFLDKPWLAVDIPRAGARTCTIQTRDAKGNLVTQNIPGGNVYVAFTKTDYDDVDTTTSKIMFTRSTDCGLTWTDAVRLSGDHTVNSGANIAIDPQTGNVYVAWRQFYTIDPKNKTKPNTDAPALFIARSTNGGLSFGTPVSIPQAIPYDRPRLPTDTARGLRSFRSNGFPSLAVDNTGRVYIAWANRAPGNDVQIAVSSSRDGISNWTNPNYVDPPPQGSKAYQAMPALAFAGGKVAVVFYDFRDDWLSGQTQLPGLERLVYDEYPDKTLWHAVDVRVATAVAGDTPRFTPIRVSKYHYALVRDSAGRTVGIQQLDYNAPNYPMFADGTTPYLGDYIDIVPSPAFVVDASGKWTYNSASTDAPVFQTAWTDNRDVSAPRDGDWTKYLVQTTPTAPICRDDSARYGMRNQNIYSSEISEGLIVNSPGNNKPLGKIQRSFVVWVKNTTRNDRVFRLTIDPPGTGVQASFLQFESKASLDVAIGGNSSIARSVFVFSTTPKVPVRVKVAEVDRVGGTIKTGGLQSSIVLNPDRLNPDLIDPDAPAPGVPVLDLDIAETYNPDILPPEINVFRPVPATLSLVSLNRLGLTDPTLLNSDVANPDIANPNILNPNILNPNILNPNILNPNILNPNILNPNILNPDIVDLNKVSVQDISWQIQNKGNTASTFSFKTLLRKKPEGFKFQLMVYRLSYSTAINPNTCKVMDLAHQELLVNINDPDILNPNILNPNILNPNILNPNILNPNILNPDIENATFYAAPGETIVVKLRVFNLDKDKNTITYTDNAGVTRTLPPDGNLPPDLFTKSLDTVAFNGEPVNAAVVAQEVNTKEADLGITQPPIATTSLVITTTGLPVGQQNTAYSQQLTADGGQAPYTWTILQGKAALNAAGIDLSPSGVLSSARVTASGSFRFTVQALDAFSPARTATTDLTLTIAPPAGTATLFFVTQPSAVRAGDSITPPVSVKAVNSAGAPVIGQNVAIALAANPGASTLGGTLTVATDDTGIAVFSGLTLNNAGSGYTLRASASGYTAVISSPFDVIPPVSVATASLPDAFLGSRYETTLQPGGGLPPYVWSASGLPSGLSLDTASGLISGTPTTLGTFNITVNVTDGGFPEQTSSRVLTLNVVPPILNVAISNPNGVIGQSKIPIRIFALPPATLPAVTGVQFTTNGSADAGLTVTDLIATSSQVSFLLAVNGNAQLGPHTVVLQPGNVVTSAIYSVFATNPVPPPTVSSILPAAAAVNQPIVLAKIAGGGLGAVTGVEFRNGSTPDPAISLSSIAANATDISLTINIASNAAQGSRSVVLVTTSGFVATGATFQLGPPVTPAPPAWNVSRVAGAPASSGSRDGFGAEARFENPADAWSDGTYVYIAGLNDRNVRRVRISDGEVTTIAGAAGYYGSVDGIGTAARFAGVLGITGDGQGNLYVSENGAIRKIVLASGEVSTLAGAALAGAADGIGSTARFNVPRGMWIDAQNQNLFVVDSGNFTIRKVVLATGAVTTIAGMPGTSGPIGLVTPVDGVGLAARFTNARGIWGENGFLYVGDGSRIRKIEIATGTVSTLPVSPGPSVFDLVGDGAGNLYVTDSGAQVIRKIVLSDPTGFSTVAGSPFLPGSADGLGTAARFNSPLGIAIAGNRLFVTDSLNHSIRQIALTSNPAVVTTLAGPVGVSGTVNGDSNTARFILPAKLAGDANHVFVGQSAGGGLIRQITLGAGLSVTSIAATANILPSAMWSDGTDLFVADGRVVRKVSPATGGITVIAGSTTPGFFDGVGAAARFSSIQGMVGDGQGNLFVADTGNVAIRRIVIATGAVTTFAGTPGTFGFNDGVGTSARFLAPRSIASDGVSLFVADSNTIRKITIATANVTTLAGALFGVSADIDGVGTAAGFAQISEIATDGTYVYVTESNNGVIRRVAISSGEVTTIAGSLDLGSINGSAPAARFNAAAGLFWNGTDLFVADSVNQTIRRLTTQPFSAVAITTAGLPAALTSNAYSFGLSASGGTGDYQWSVASGALPAGLSLDSTGLISGTPSTAGNSTFTAKVVDVSAIPPTEATKQFTLQVVNPLVITTASPLPSGRADYSYSQTLTVSGGTGAQTWLVISGSLPSGLSLGVTSGVIAGTAQTVGTFNFTVRATDQGSAQTATKAFTLTINGPAITSPANLGTWSMGTLQIPLAATGGMAPYSWTLTGGSVPTGTTLDTRTPSFFLPLTSAGIIGVATTTGNYSFSAAVQDAAGLTTSRGFNLTITSLTILDSFTLPDAFTTSPYSYSFAAGGAQGAVTWQVAPGTTLPPGLTLSGNTLSGTPTTPGPTFVSLTATGVDSSGSTVTVFRRFDLLVSGVEITTPGMLSSATSGAAYSVSLAARGGTGTYDWFYEGSLPPGLGLNSSTGVIAGTAFGSGTYRFIVHANSGGKSYQKSFSINVVDDWRRLPVIYPKDVDDFTLATPRSIVIGAYDGAGPYTWSATGLPAGLSLRTGAAGHSWLSSTDAEITGSVMNTGTYTFTIQLTDTGANPQVTISRQFTFNVGVLNNDSPPDAVLGVPYSFDLRTMGGPGPWGASIDYGALPAGLTLSANGLISGTPQESGSFSIRARLNNAAGAEIHRTLYINVPGNGGVSISSYYLLPRATVGQQYGAFFSNGVQLSACCGVMTWSPASSLPAGMTLSPDGLLSGTPTQSGITTFLVRAETSTGYAVKQFTLAISPLQMTSSSTLPSAVIGMPYTASLAASGGTAPYTWTLMPGQMLPDGLSISGNTITGTPTANSGGHYYFNVLLRDGALPQNTTIIPMDINVFVAGAAPVIFTSSDLGSIPVGRFETPLMADGGGGPYIWSVAPGSTLPPGLRIRTDNPVWFAPEWSSLSGIATAEGTYTFTLRATSLGGTGNFSSRTFTLKTTKMMPRDPWTLPHAFVGTPYSYSFSTTTGVNAHWQAYSVPDGLTLSDNGTLSGTPTQAGQLSVYFNVTDGSSTVFRSSTLIVSAVNITTSGALPNAYQGQSYTPLQLQAMPLSGQYVWTATWLPMGMSLSQSGVLSGTPQFAGNVFISVTATNTLTNDSYTKPFSLNVVGSPALLPSLTNAAFTNDFVIGQPQSWGIYVNGGTAPYSWNAQGLPPGLELRTGANRSSYIPPYGAELSGVAIQTGAYNITISVTDSSNPPVTTSQVYRVNVVAMDIDWPPDGSRDVPYSHYLRTIGGAQSTYSWSIDSEMDGQLPAGLTLNSSTGVISGTPLEDGFFNANYVITNGSDTLRRSVGFRIGAPTTISISTYSLPVGTPNQPYNWPLAADGAASIAWTLLNDATHVSTLPPGITFNNGVLSGTPTSSGKYWFFVKAADAGNDNNYTIRRFAVDVTPLLPSTWSLNSGSVGQPYTFQLQTTGGTAPYTWTLSRDTLLPPGITLQPGGLLTGTPTSAGTYSFTIILRDSADPANARKVWLAMNVYPFVPARITTTSLPDGSTLAAYSQTLAASDGVPPYHWSVYVGPLPAGLTLSDSGVISGTPTTTGTTSFTVKAADSNPYGLFATKNLSITVSNQAPTNDVSTSYTWKYATGIADPSFAQWSNGDLLVGSTANGTMTYVLEGAVGSTVTRRNYLSASGRTSIWKPKGETAAEVSLWNYGSFQAYRQDGSQVWDNPVFGCCGFSSGGYTIDPIRGINWSNRSVTFDLRIGGHAGDGIPEQPGGVYAAKDYVWFAYNGSVNRYKIGNTSDAKTYSLGLPNDVGAIAADQSLILTAPQVNGKVARFQTDGTTAWQITMDNPASPVVTATDDVIVGGEDGAGKFVRALAGATGATLWTARVDSTVKDMLVGDSSNLYVAIGSGKVLALDVGTGIVRHQYINVPSPTQLALHSGKLFVISGTDIIAFTVDSSFPDVKSPWRTRYSDSQVTWSQHYFTITPFSMPDAVAGMPFTKQLAGVDGIGALTWSLSGGSALPDGLTFDSSGLISGTATTAGTYTFTISVTDSDATPRTVTRDYTMRVAGP